MERITLRTFLTCMILCACGVITAMWFEERVPEAFFKATGTLFVIGFGSALVWATLIAYRFLEK